MSKVVDWMQNTLLPKIHKVGNNKSLMAMRDGVSSIIPYTIIGSVFMIITNFPIEAWTNFIEPYMGILSIPSTVCMGLLSLIACFSVASSFAKYDKINRETTGMIALVAFVITQTDPVNGIDVSNFGTSGLFLAMVVAVVSEKIVKLFTEKNWQIKLPESVPPMVYDSFAALLPGFVIVVLFWLITSVFGINVNAILSTILSPLIGGLDTLPGTLFLVLISTLLWCCGINETVLDGVTTPIWYAFLAENAAAFAAGDMSALHFGAYGWQYFGFWLGGTGGTIALVVLMMRSKAKEYRELGNLSIAPALFQINEPVAFGFPIVFNPIMCIPYILVPLVTTTVYYCAVALHLCNPVVAAVPWTTPPVINVLIATGFDWRAIIVQLINLCIAFAIYYPFFKYEERKALARQEEVKA